MVTVHITRIVCCILCAVHLGFAAPQAAASTRRTSSTRTTSTTRSATTPSPSGRWISPEYTWIFQNPLPKAPVKTPKLTWTDEATGAVIDYYETTILPFKKQIYPNLNATDMIGYDGMAPGPTLKMKKGKEAIIRYSNNATKDIAVHVHGQYSRAPFDGWADDKIAPGEYKDFYYPNTQNSRTMWYHDHAAFTTAEGAYFGQAAAYILTDDHEASLNLPSGDYDVGLAMEAKLYYPNGSLLLDTNNNTGLWGDIIQVNGQPWPYLAVEPRKYRFRLLNGAISRTFHLSLNVDDDGSNVTMTVISSDSGLLASPVDTTSILQSMGERYDVIVDFASYPGKNITLNNARSIGENPDYAATNYVMRFVVGDTVTNSESNGEIPAVLRNISFPDYNSTSPDKDFTFSRSDGDWLINGVGFEDVDKRILAKPARGRVERWRITNGGEGTHPVHVHLVDFHVVSRTGGRNAVAPYEGAGYKDTVYLQTGETVDMIAQYAPWDGQYMFHCHNLIHEDHDMLVVMNVTGLTNWTYDNSSGFTDPMEEKFRPKPISPEDFDQSAIVEKIGWFYDLSVYDHGKEDELISALNDYWDERNVEGSTAAPAESAGTTSSVRATTTATTTGTRTAGTTGSATGTTATTSTNSPIGTVEPISTTTTTSTTSSPSKTPSSTTSSSSQSPSQTTSTAKSAAAAAATSDKGSKKTEKDKGSKKTTDSHDGRRRSMFPHETQRWKGGA